MRARILKSGFVFLAILSLAGLSYAGEDFCKAPLKNLLGAKLTPQQVKERTEERAGFFFRSQLQYLESKLLTNDEAGLIKDLRDQHRVTGLNFRQRSLLKSIYEGFRRDVSGIHEYYRNGYEPFIIESMAEWLAVDQKALKFLTTENFSKSASKPRRVIRKSRRNLAAMLLALLIFANLYIADQNGLLDSTYDFYIGKILEGLDEEDYRQNPGLFEEVEDIKRGVLSGS